MSEKYLRQIAAWAAQVRIEEWFTSVDTAEYQTLVESVRKMHDPHLTEQDVSYFLLGRLVDSVAGVSRTRTGLLTDALNKDLRDGFCESVRGLIESLPWAIRIHFPLWQFIHFAELELKINDSISFKTNWEGPSFTEKNANKLAPLAIARKQAWLSIDVKGYIAKDVETGALSNAISQVKQCLYFLSLFSWAGLYNSQAQLVNAVATSPQLQQRVRLPHSLARYLGTLTPHYEVLKIYDTESGKNLLNGRFRMAVNPDERAIAVQGKLRDAQEFFKRRDDPDFDAIAAAIEWYMDSVTADNQTFAYIAACIGLEALLGYGDASERMDAMSSRLCDRYGYLLGAGRNERERLSAEYRDILSLRGKLVHARSKRLTNVEQAKLSQVNQMLQNVIAKEIKVFINT